MPFHNAVYSPREVLEAVNYGEPLLYPYLANPGNKFHSHIFLTWDVALITDVAKCLFGDNDAEELMQRLSENLSRVGWMELSETGRFENYNFLTLSLPEGDTPREKFQEGWAIAEDLYTLLSALGRRRAKDYRMYPHSYGVNRLIQFVKYLREGVKKDLEVPPGRLTDFFENNPASWEGDLRKIGLSLR
jgi:hypothetical protein